jgi:hypothetical protein
VHIADANRHGDAKPNTYCNSHSYAYTDIYTHGNGNSYSHAHGNPFADANVRSGRYSWSVDTGSAGSH